MEHGVQAAILPDQDVLVQQTYADYVWAAQPDLPARDMSYTRLKRVAHDLIQVTE